MYAGTKPSFFHLDHLTELEPGLTEPCSLYRAWGKLGISGQNVNEPTYTHCCHLHLVYMVDLDGTFRPSPPGFWKCLASFRILSLTPVLTRRYVTMPFLQQIWISSLRKYRNISSFRFRAPPQISRPPLTEWKGIPSRKKWSLTFMARLWDKTEQSSWMQKPHPSLPTS